jgi:hypothetical protein
MNLDCGRGAVTCLKVLQEGGDHLYATRESIEAQVAVYISIRYRIAQGAPITQDACLHRDFGYLADTKATDKVFQGTYEHPPDMEKSTKPFLQEAHHIF